MRHLRKYILKNAYDEIPCCCTRGATSSPLRSPSYCQMGTESKDIPAATYLCPCCMTGRCFLILNKKFHSKVISTSPKATLFASLSDSLNSLCLESFLSPSYLASCDRFKETAHIEVIEMTPVQNWSNTVVNQAQEGGQNQKLTFAE
ncbi:heparan-sulfate 6-O-sulfotransferase 2 [Platysternon megacephalum]|uniref:Heparan-sulfate 6-O-sulfotransferase 2 n=1 Tax=Platysternon megacephalum TaxID=55544 RepID=A0A4D9FCQ5_9SAUR|nr:heparan-sulfate 6-O-sulfotransferase 2 [Platysternon megacephalum]